MRRLLLCMFGVALLASCGNPTTQSDVPAAATVGSPSPTTQSDVPAAAPVGTSSPTTIVAPDQVAVPDSLAFSAPLVGGGTVDLAQYAGTPVVLWFWAPT